MEHRRRAQLFSETPARGSASAASRRSATSSASTSRPSRARRPTRSSSTSRSAEKPTGTFQVGAGFSSIENFIATAQVQQANLFGNGQSLALQAQVSGLRQLVSLRFFEPYFLDSRSGRQRGALRHALRLPRLRAPQRRRLGSPSATRSSSRGCASASRAPLEQDTVDTPADQHVLRRDPRLRQRLPAPAAREPLQRRPRRSRCARPSPTTRATTASSRRRASSCRPRPSSRATLPRQPDSSTSATASRGASTTRSAAASACPAPASSSS